MSYETIFLVLILVVCVKQTGTDHSSSCSWHLRPPKYEYHLTKECTVSNMRTVASSNATKLESCVQLAATKNAFALTYADLAEGTVSTLSSTCNVFDCPEFHPFLLTANESVYDYYSMYSKPLPSENYTCAPGLGVFELVTNHLNYSNAMIACEDAGGHLANVVSDSRTSFLAALVSSDLKNKTLNNRKAFVGLFFENEFVTITGEPLSCMPFRAWAPGHPKAGRPKKECVVLTGNRYWETEDCAKKFPYICELVPDGPLSLVERYCAPIKNTKKNCILRNHKQFEQIEQTKQQCNGIISTNKSVAINDNN
ncbi:uncharacterized protein LOC112597892 [Melanaphis sacchari]|uniref:uncharacterized protein LOC112596667 n=1 Tax=Melanaphis sacchari TaxID=742174 RepID=UPI000DC13C24|nr:uncharacterized protein LOC112596667 [Melanaphis sacchari]XP_025199902.1 uncharacterized protein LOC112597892 [Melanaphis sacchari]